MRVADHRETVPHTKEITHSKAPSGQELALRNFYFAEVDPQLFTSEAKGGNMHSFFLCVHHHAGIAAIDNCLG